MLNPGQQALLVLVYLRKDETYAVLAADFGASTATAKRSLCVCCRHGRNGETAGLEPIASHAYDSKRSNS
ncbi:helix-turn-helix domain-containing protein [Streptosporangium sandarakinum]